VNLDLRVDMKGASASGAVVENPEGELVFLFVTRGALHYGSGYNFRFLAVSLKYILAKDIHAAFVVDGLNADQIRFRCIGGNPFPDDDIPPLDFYGIVHIGNIFRLTEVALFVGIFRVDFGGVYVKCDGVYGLAEERAGAHGA